MLYYLLRRFLYMLLTIVLVSVVAFTLIQLPPGDYLTSYIMQLESQGSEVSESEIASLRRQYGLDRPMHVQYLKWVWNIITRGDFGRSFQWNKPVKHLIWERMAITTAITIAITAASHHSERQTAENEYENDGYAAQNQEEPAGLHTLPASSGCAACAPSTCLTVHS